MASKPTDLHPRLKTTKAYRAFRSGLGYSDAAAMLWVDSDNPDDWQQKSRGAILSILGKLKREMYLQATGLEPDEEQPAEPAAAPYPDSWNEVAADPDPAYPMLEEALLAPHRDESPPAYGLAA